MKYINFTIGDKNVDLKTTEDIPISISYSLEDTENFQVKDSSNSFDLEIPATIDNEEIGNTFHNPAIEDLTGDEIYRRPLDCKLIANGEELLTGKAFLKSATHTDRPLAYVYDCYGDNANWAIDLKEATLYDFLKRIVFYFTKVNIQASYLFDGTDENLPYVFAPMKYGDLMNNNDADILPSYMKPSISAYFIIYWAFKSVGYKIQSDFFNTEFFRRLVMPWTWGGFLFTEGTKQDNLKFLAKSTDTVFYSSNKVAFVDVKATNETTNGAFDNNGVYTYFTSSGEMRWTYLPAFDLGLVAVTFRAVIDFQAYIGGTATNLARLHWYKNGVEDVTKRTTIESIFNSGNGAFTNVGLHDVFQSFNVVAGDYISMKIEVSLAHLNNTSYSKIYLNVNEFSFQYAKIVLGGLINFDTYVSFKNYKVLDFFRGIVDFFNLEFKTDNINKVVVIEPTHEYELPGTAKQTGYFNSLWLDWDEKQELSKKSTVTLESDGERELIFKFKDDSNDGMLKTVQDRNKVTLGVAKYVLPDRFKAGKKEAENRFFSPVMHYEVTPWKNITGKAPQMIVLVPENISNTSQAEAQNTFLPKLCYYKGVDNTVGWVSDGSPITGFPFAFAVNYTLGGENDPVISYTDEQIYNGIDFNIAKGLLKRFYWQRLANMRNGQNYLTWMLLNNYDITNSFHREYKILKGQKWELLKINDYKPLINDSTEVLLRKYAPISEHEKDNTFPSATAVLTNVVSANKFDIKYFPLKCFLTDIPKPK